MHGLTFLQDLAIVMAVSAAVMVLCQLIRVPVVLGYILAGLIIGPHTPPFPLVTDVESIQTLSELGVIFLLFGIGLEFSLRKLLRVGLVSLLAATLEIVLMVWLGFSLGRLFGWSFMDSVFLGAILSISSTTIIAKVLLESGRLREPFAQVILGILIVEDMLAIIIIALLSGITSTGALTFREIGTATVHVFAFVAGTLFLGLWSVPKLLRYLQRFHNPEMMIITVLGLCFGVSLIAAKLGFSVALGAFLIGAVIAETRQVRDVIHRTEPIRDMFTAIFFVSVGMLLDPELLTRYAGPILIITAVTIVGKVASCSFAAFLTGYDSATSLRVGLGLAQIGEFSFIIARLGETTRVTSSFLYPLAVSVSGITTMTTPFLMRYADRIVRALTTYAPKPLVTVGDLYLGWLQRLKSIGVSPGKHQMLWEGLRKFLPRLLLYLVAVFAVPFGASLLAQRVPIPPIAYWLAVGIVMVPILFGLAYTIDRILWDVIALNILPWKEETEQAEEARDLLHDMMRVVLVIICGLPLLMLGALFVPFVSISVSAVGLIAVSSLIFWGSARRFHEHLERVVLGLFEPEAPWQEQHVRQTHDDLVQLIREEYPWEVETQDVVLPYQESAVNQTIKALRLRTVTGATIGAIYRGEEALVNPSPDTRLMPGDVVLLMGSQEQITAAAQFLQQKMQELPVRIEKTTEQAKTQRVEIAPECAWVGKTLGTVNLRRNTGVHVVGIQRAGAPMTNPDAEVTLQAGDLLFLFGLEDQLERAKVYLAQGHP